MCVNSGIIVVIISCVVFLWDWVSTAMNNVGLIKMRYFCILFWTVQQTFVLRGRAFIQLVQSLCWGWWSLDLRWRAQLTVPRLPELKVSAESTSFQASAGHSLSSRQHGLCQGKLGRTSGEQGESSRTPWQLHEDHHLCMVYWRKHLEAGPYSGAGK
jgi:hypothetical protein